MIKFIKRYLKISAEKSKIVEEHQALVSHRTELFRRWNEMLTTKPSIKILEGDNDTTLNIAYSEFARNINGKGRLGSIWSIDKKDFQIKDGKFYYFIEYREFVLKDNVAQADYEEALASYEHYRSLVDAFEKENKIS